jgi:ribonucleoside-triphosphate reductase
MNINIRLDKNFTTQYNKLQDEFGTQMANLNGFDDGQLSYTDFIDNFIDEPTVADSSIDGNSNVRRKDIVTLFSEMPKPHRKVLAFNKIHYEYQKLWGFKPANDWLRREWTGQLYMHDPDTSTFKSYCFAYDLKDLAEKGLYFLTDTFNAQPPKHLTTFVDFVKEFISFNSNRTSGACGLPNLIPYMFYFWKKDYDKDYLGVRTSNNADIYARQNFQRFIYAVNQPCVRDGQQSAFTNTSVFDRPYFEALFGGSTFPDGTYMIDFEDEIIEFQKIYMEVMSDIRAENMFTFPVSTISLLRKEGKFIDEEFAQWAIRHNMKWSDSNLFIDDNVSSLSNCCRLKSDIRDLGYFNSIGGTALKVGSVKVCTINLARLALDTNTIDEYLAELAERTLSAVRALHVVRHIIQRNVEKGLLPNFTYGLIDFEHLYNTIGFIGIYETMKKFGCTRTDELGNVYYTEKAAEFGKKIFEVMRGVADKFIADNKCDYMINTEQIPGESAASKLMRKDKFFYPDAEIYDLPLYGNQFIPLGIKTTLQERIRVQAMFDSFCNGGSILHANIDAPFDSYEKAYRMTCYIADAGVTYFAFNTKIQACEDNHAFYGTTCPVCGKPIATEYTRVVGFYTPIKTWSKDRTSEYKMRRWENVNENKRVS